MSKKQANVSEKIGEKNTLSVHNYGDLVVIKNRSAIGGGIFGAMIMVFSVLIAVKMKDAWSSPGFWCGFLFLFLCSAYWFANAVLGKVILDSPKRTMTVYGPFKKEYSFSEVNYVETVSAKPKNGHRLHSVYVYLGNGRRNVRIDTLSFTQATEVETLLKSMLDSGDVGLEEEPKPTFTPETTSENSAEIPKKRRSTALLERFGRGTKKTAEPKVTESKPVINSTVTARDPFIPAKTESTSFSTHYIPENAEPTVLTRETPIPERAEATPVSRDAELDQYEAHLIRRNKK